MSANVSSQVKHWNQAARDANVQPLLKMTYHKDLQEDQRQIKRLQIVDEGKARSARAQELALHLGVGLSTLLCWRRQFAGVGDDINQHTGGHQHGAQHLSEGERQRILLTCNEPKFAGLPPGQIVPMIHCWPGSTLAWPVGKR